MALENGRRICLCGIFMVWVGDLKYYHVYSCPDCLRILMISTNTPHQAWYLPEAELKSFKFHKRQKVGG